MAALAINFKKNTYTYLAIARVTYSLLIVAVHGSLVYLLVVIVIYQFILEVVITLPLK